MNANGNQTIVKGGLALLFTVIGGITVAVTNSATGSWSRTLASLPVDNAASQARVAVLEAMVRNTESELVRINRKLDKLIERATK